MTSSYWPQGVPRHLHYPAVSVGELLTGICRHFADLVAIEDGDEQLTYGGLLARASRMAHALRADGIGPGDTVLLHLPNGRDSVVAYAGIQLAGATVSPANPLSTVAGLRHQLEDSRSRILVTHPDHVETAVAASRDTSVQRVVVTPGSTGVPRHTSPITVNGATGWETYVAGHPEGPPAAKGTPDDVAHLAFTGGTTGVSKGVRVLNRNVVGNVCQAVAWRAGALITMDGAAFGLSLLGHDDVGLPPGRGVSVIAGPMYHAHALINLLAMLATGTRIIIMGRFSPERMLELIESRRATYITGSPTMWHALLSSPGAHDRDLSSLQVVSSGAAPINVQTLRALRSIFPSAMVNEGYGLTEGTCIVTSAPGFHSARRKLGSVGQPLPDTEIEVRGSDGDVLAPGQPGEIWVRGPQVTDGYQFHDDLTREQYVDGWLRTGDVGHVDEEGFLFISDRVKDMLIYKGYNVYPRELEEVLLEHPDVDVAAVVGRSDDAVGQLPVAFVVPRAGTAVAPEEIMAFVAARVLPYKKIREVHVLDALPSNPAGKILKTELRARLT